MWVVPSDGNLDKREMEEGSLLFACLFSFLLANSSVLSLQLLYSSQIL